MGLDHSELSDSALLLKASNILKKSGGGDALNKEDIIILEEVTNRVREYSPQIQQEVYYQEMAAAIDAAGGCSICGSLTGFDCTCNCDDCGESSDDCNCICHPSDNHVSYIVPASSLPSGNIEFQNREVKTKKHKAEGVVLSNELITMVSGSPFVLLTQEDIKKSIS